MTRSFVGSVAIALQQHQVKRSKEPFAFFDFQPALPLPLANRAG